MESIKKLERVTYRFHIIQKDVQTLAYSMRVNDIYNLWESTFHMYTEIRKYGSVFRILP